jgi:hypothetical protein
VLLSDSFCVVFRVCSGGEFFQNFGASPSACVIFCPVFFVILGRLVFYYLPFAVVMPEAYIGLGVNLGVLYAVCQGHFVSFVVPSAHRLNLMPVVRSVMI